MVLGNYGDLEDYVMRGKKMENRSHPFKYKMGYGDGDKDLYSLNDYVQALKEGAYGSMIEMEELATFYDREVIVVESSALDDAGGTTDVAVTRAVPNRSRGSPEFWEKLDKERGNAPSTTIYLFCNGGHYEPEYGEQAGCNVFASIPIVNDALDLSLLHIAQQEIGIPPIGDVSRASLSFVITPNEQDKEEEDASSNRRRTGGGMETGEEGGIWAKMVAGEKSQGLRYISHKAGWKEGDDSGFGDAGVVKDASSEDQVVLAGERIDMDQQRAILHSIQQQKTATTSARPSSIVAEHGGSNLPQHQDGKFDFVLWFVYSVDSQLRSQLAAPRYLYSSPLTGGRTLVHVSLSTFHSIIRRIKHVPELTPIEDDTRKLEEEAEKLLLAVFNFSTAMYRNSLFNLVHSKPGSQPPEVKTEFEFPTTVDGVVELKKITEFNKYWKRIVGGKAPIDWLALPSIAGAIDEQLVVFSYDTARGTLEVTRVEPDRSFCLDVQLKATDKKVDKDANARGEPVSLFVVDRHSFSPTVDSLPPQYEAVVRQWSPSMSEIAAFPAWSLIVSPASLPSASGTEDTTMEDSTQAAPDVGPARRAPDPSSTVGKLVAKKGARTLQQAPAGDGIVGGPVTTEIARSQHSTTLSSSTRERALQVVGSGSRVRSRSECFLLRSASTRSARSCFSVEQ